MSRTPHRLIFIAALIAGASYFVATKTLPDGWWLTVWKGAGVGLLALWAAACAREWRGWVIAGVLALGTAGDVLLDAAGLTIGAIAFLAGHLLAASLYWHQRRRTGQGWPIAIGRLVLIPGIAWFLPADRAAAPGITLYASGLALMAAAAWLSRFPRLWVARGALFFAVSDLLIFARMGPLAGSGAPDWLVWPLYFAGQAMIAWGVVTTLAKDAVADAKRSDSAAALG